MVNGEVSPTWAELPANTRELLRGKLAGLWEQPTDATAFDSWALDKKQAMLLLLERFESKGRFRAYMERVPSFVIEASTSPALLGAARALDEL